jgi:hypothetical protein
MQRNIGKIERILRLCLGLVICTSVVLQGSINLADTLLMVVGSFLILNGLTARCYLWRWLGISSSSRAETCGLAHRNQGRR